MIKILLIIVIAAVVVFSAFTAFEDETGKNYGGSNPLSSAPFLTLTANISNPSPQANFKYGYVSPNLWGIQYHATGNAIMSAYSNSSLHFIANFSSIQSGIVVIGYPSEHFVQTNSMSVLTAIKDNLSSFVSFSVKNINQGTGNDFAYDLFLGQGQTLQYEIMVMLLTGTKGIVVSPIASVYIPTTVNGTLTNIEWKMYNGLSSSGNFPEYEFIPSINMNGNMSYVVNISSFLSFLVNNGYVPSSSSIIRMGIGSEFGTGDGATSVYYSFWMYSYFILNGTKYQVVQPQEVL